MLHADRDKVEKPVPLGREETPRCPGPQSKIAGRYAALMARDDATRDFARRFFLTTALLWQHAACLDDAVAEARAGIELFPRDAELYLTAGCALEERAVLTTRSVPRDVPAVQKEWLTPFVPRDPPAEQKAWLEEARDDFAEAVAHDPELVLARVRLGRVLWRLGQPEAASEALAAALSRAHDARDLYLAHLFLGRVHEDGRRLDLALAEYRRALDVDPETQSAAVAVAHALQLLGEAEESRRALTRGLTDGRWKADAYSDYLADNTLGADRMEAALHRESLE
jgi:tetratricopeptide (TPR) repeat protein